MRKEIGDRLKQIRASLTQQEMAERLGVVLRTYASYERGERAPDADALLVLADEGWNAHWLLTGQGPERLEAPQSTPDGLQWDRNTLRSAIETVESALDIADVPFSAQGRAALIESIYRHLVKKQHSAESVAEALRMIREALKSG